MIDPSTTGLAGFGSVDLTEALVGGLPSAVEKVEAHALFTAPAGMPSAGGVWIVLDFMDFDLSVVNSIKQAAAAACVLKQDRIHVLTTHNHGAGSPDHIGRISELAAKAAKEAVFSARPAVVRGIKVALPDGINFRRRIHVPEFDGMWTTFAGPDMGERRSAAGFIEKAIHTIENGQLSYFGWEPSARPAPDFGPGDPDFFLMEFQDAETGAPLGTLSRFAMHAIMRSNPSYFSSDYPWHLREEAKARFGGSSIFMNGPCGDLAPCFPWPDKTTGLERQYAKRMLDAAEAKLKALPFEPLVTRHERHLVALPVREEVLAGNVTMEGPLPPASDLPARKRYLERDRIRLTIGFLEGKYRNGESVLSNTVTIELGALQLANWLIVAYPGETFSGTARAVAERFPEANLVSVTEHGRTVMYLPPEEEYLQGGYEPTCAVTSPGAEAMLDQAATKLVEDTLKQSHKRAPYTTETFRNDLLEMGVTPEDTLLIHSSFKAIGPVDGGPDAVLDALMAFFGERGLLVFPTLSYSVVSPGHPFDVRRTPTSCGILPELFRQRPGVLRSLHPTHSVAAFGPDAAEFISGHEQFDTPCAKGSPWRTLLERPAKIIFIATGIEHNTFCHGVDEWLELPGLRSSELKDLEVIDADGIRHPTPQYCHCVPRNALYGTYETIFNNAGALRRGHFGNAPCWLLDCRLAASSLGVKF